MTRQPAKWCWLRQQQRRVTKLRRQLRLLEEALRAGRRSTQLINYGRELATRFGSLELRELVDEARRDATEQG